MKAARFPIRSATRDVHLEVNVEVVGLRSFRVRLAIAHLLLRLAGWIIGCGVSFQEQRR